MDPGRHCEVGLLSSLDSWGRTGTSTMLRTLVVMLWARRTKKGPQCSPGAVVSVARASTSNALPFQPTRCPGEALNVLLHITGSVHLCAICARLLASLCSSPTPPRDGVWHGGWGGVGRFRSWFLPLTVKRIPIASMVACVGWRVPTCQSSSVLTQKGSTWAVLVFFPDKAPG